MDRQHKWEKIQMMETESGKFHYLYIVLSSYYTRTAADRSSS